MSENTKIEWCDATFNPWIGCTKVSPGCDHCYAECSTPARTLQVNWGPGAPRRRTSAANWALPKRWNAQAAAFMAQHDRRQRVFCASLADVFDNAAEPKWRVDLLQLIADTPNLDWLLLTKRIGNAHAMLDEVLSELSCGLTRWMDVPWPNVWLGATIVNQAEADRDIPKLLAVPAAKRFLSMEPLLGAVDLRSISHGDGEINALKPDTWEEAIDLWRDTSESWIEDFEDWYGVNLSDGLTGPAHAGIDWVIVGGESGPGARPMHPDWARSLLDQCKAAGVPFLFKQWGEWGEPDSIERTNLAHQGWFEQDRLDGGVPRHEWQGPMQNGVELASLRPEVFRVGKKAAGRLLDGRTWDEVPT